MRFRAGCHDLPVDVGRRAGIPRLRRVCEKCHAPVVADERHLVFECTAMQVVRGKYPSLFVGPGQTMQQFMWQHNVADVVRFVRDCMRLLQDGAD